MIRAARTFLKLPFSDMKTVLFLVGLIPIVEVLLLSIGFKRTASLIWNPKQRSSLADKETARLLKRHARLMRKVVRVLPFGRCLAQSLVLGRVLQSKGVSVALVFGQSKADHKLAAHAWLEYQGKPVNESAAVAKKYVPFQTPVLTTES